MVRKQAPGTLRRDGWPLVANGQTLGGSGLRTDFSLLRTQPMQLG